jgi:hypothetical protein
MSKYVVLSNDEPLNPGYPLPIDGERSVDGVPL